MEAKCVNNKSFQDWNSDDYEKWKTFLGALVERYDGDENWGPGTEPDEATKAAIRNNPITHWEVLNEPPADPEENSKKYIDLLAITYSAIKSRYPNNNSKVVLAATGRLYWPFFQRIFHYMNDPIPNGKGWTPNQYPFDIIAIHPYRDPWDGPPYPTLSEDIDRIRYGYPPFWDGLTAFGDANKPIWITELGWSTTPGGIGVVDELTQAQYLVDSYNIAKDKNIQNFFWHEFKPGVDWTTYNKDDKEKYPTDTDYKNAIREGEFGLLHYDNSKKPSFYAFQDLASGVYSATPYVRHGRRRNKRLVGF